MSAGIRIPLAQAQGHAQRVVAALAPYCERLEVAGSVRREADTVGDLEIVCVPRTRDLLALATAVEKLGPAEKGQVGGRYARRRLQGTGGLCLDLFMCTAQTWACNLLIRTGSVDFSRRVMTLALMRGHKFQDAQLWRLDDAGMVVGRVEVQEEVDVFRALRLRYVDPRDRDDARFLP